jgi:hypothetical protein
VQPVVLFFQGVGEPLDRRDRHLTIAGDLAVFGRIRRRRLGLRLRAGVSEALPVALEPSPDGGSGIDSRR